MKITNEMMVRLSDTMVEFMKAEGFQPGEVGFVVLVLGPDGKLMSHLASGGMESVPIIPTIVRAAADRIEAGTSEDPAGVVSLSYPGKAS